MSSACEKKRPGIAASMCCALLLFGCTSTVAAQPPAWSVPGYGIYPEVPTRINLAGRLESTQAGDTAAWATAGAAESRPMHRAPLARVVRNPDQSGGLPPFALTDDSGTIQRYVEAVPGLDLESYVGTVVRVRHDTGRTLLASQLEFPPQPLKPLAEPSVSESQSSAVADVLIPRGTTSRSSGRVRIVRPVEFVDDDDATVQLLAETEERLPDGADDESTTVPGEVEATTPMGADDLYPTFPDGVTMEGGPMMGETMGMGGPMMEMGVPGTDVGPGMEGPMMCCPQCGGCPYPSDCDEMPNGIWRPTCQCREQKAYWFADVQFNFLRTHIMENFAGKLSEKYEFSPRVIIGFNGTGQIDGRARYWHYGRNTHRLDGGGSIRIDFDVVDLEATRTVELRDSALLFAAGLRTANIDLRDHDGDTAGCDLLGMTLAADFETLVCRIQRGMIVGVCGARLSILGGDWGRNNGNDFIPSQLRDDNWVVDELYAGVAYETCYRQYDLHAQLGFEMQNWHSDALSQFAGADSISFLGPGIEIGAAF